jgi:very-short-patch-repair endonuclease
MGKIVSVAAKLRRDRARRLRRDQTEVEARLWQAFRASRLDGWRWRRQAPVGSFIVDFLCLEAALVVELDGGVHAGQVRRDLRREAYLRARGLQVLRFWNAEVREDLSASAGRSSAPVASPIRRSAAGGSTGGLDRARRVQGCGLPEPPAPPTPGLSHSAARLGEEKAQSLGSREKT